MIILLSNLFVYVTIKFLTLCIKFVDFFVWDNKFFNPFEQVQIMRGIKLCFVTFAQNKPCGYLLESPRWLLLQNITWGKSNLS